ncbi:uncharacterized protein FIESC28_07302 [Fusarium coffeatum]|uniref:AB hydrolase-1 domain-containing protein n=1 Tax=Fusarium coffeatum TaxID=231269 RepID=A0A366RET5_9HYPO|nr:uncharacterized protein FIESC28_07302 [Fusarium coffeatum]RBR15661.1 hypothetical protein FIESC28_07302 [Fusarium coffeatum]
MASQCATLASNRKISYSIHGDSPNAPWIILSNSFGTDISLSESVAQRFATAGFGVLSYDHPGHGQSSPLANVNKVNFEEMIDDIDDLLHHLKIESIHAWVGLSLGAASGVYMACRRPKLIKHLIYCGCPPASLSALGIMSHSQIDAMRDEAENDGTTANAIRHMHYGWASKGWLEANPDQDARLVLASSTLSLDGWRAVMTLQKNVNFDMRPLVPDLVASCERIMFVKGGNDVRINPLVDMMSEIVMKEDGEFKVVTVPDSGHVMFLQDEDYFCSSILDFIS